MRLLVCGDRNWTDHRLVIDTLDAIHAVTSIDVLIEGCARGADRMAGAHPPEDAEMYPTIDPGWAWVRRVPGAHYPAHWNEFRKAAGPIRNRQMLVEGLPDRVVAFHDDIAHSRGTADMLARARAAGVPCTLVSHTAVVP